MEMWEILAAILCAILMLVAIVGSILPFLPGIPLAWVGLFIYALSTDFKKISVLTIVIFFLVTVATMVVGYFAPMMGAKKQKASKLGILGSFVGLIFGVFVFGLWGVILGPFLGALLGELIAKKQTGQALRSAFGTLIGFIAGTLLQIIVILIMAGFFISSLF
jgi:uncharacterized protein YqgC (DUF456 family)